MADTSRKRRSVRQSDSRKRSVYVDPDTDDDFEAEDDDYNASDLPRKRIKTTTGTRSRRSIDTQSPPPSPHQNTESLPKGKRPTRKSERQNATTSNIVAKVAALTGNSKRRTKPKKKSIKHDQSAPIIASDGKIPLWNTLPYAVLLQIFQYAYAQNSPTWLLKTARSVCRAFTEPALNAFYQNPALPTSFHLESLHTLTQIPSEKALINYAVKVRRLELNIHGFVDRKDEGQTFELADLVADLPNLSRIAVTSLQDKPPYRRHSAPRWRYPASLFESLDNNNRRLKSWRWNWLFIKEARTQQFPEMVQTLSDIHLRPSFQTLEHLELSDFPAFGRLAEQQAREIEVAEVLGLLPNLKSLELVTCDMVHTPFTDSLPRTLTRLRIANSPGLTSDALHTYLSKDGSCQLRELILDHNVRLDLAFLPSLKQSCPNLQSLRMDLHYYSQHHTVNDADAKYDHLLGADEMPSWPSTMREIKLIHLQKWSSEGAQNLFQSLVDSAVSLPDLRKLVLHAHINIAWRDRVTFREKWIQKLRHVFLDRTEPSAHLASFKAWRKWKGIEDPLSELPPPAPGVRRFSHVELPQRHEKDEPSQMASDSDLSTKRRSKRIADTEAVALRRRSSVTSDAMSTPDNREDSSRDGDWQDGSDTFIQGLCDIVDIRIDNQRPREEQYNESHFLDSEESGDEEWTEGDELPGDGYAW